MYSCETCKATFYTSQQCDGHMSQFNHWPQCETCDRTFRTMDACEQHMDAKDHWGEEYECETCTATFASEEDCDRHMDTFGHWPQCNTCDRLFRTQQACDQHMNAKDHWAQLYECETCSRKFQTQSAADNHMNALGHWSCYCRDCDRHFSNENNLRQHLKSKAHLGKTMLCPFCKKPFVTASGLVHHLERGSCPQAENTDRETIWRMIREIDPEGKFTNKDARPTVKGLIQYQVTDQAFNGYYWECYICHGKFLSKHGLNSHLNSQVHDKPLYHCPNSKCGKQFTTLAGLFSHLESETCSFMRFKDVQRRVTDIFQGGLLKA